MKKKMKFQHNLNIIMIFSDKMYSKKIATILILSFLILGAKAQQMFFAFGKANLTPVGEETLNFLLEQLKANPTLKLEIMGYSDKQEDSVAIEKPLYADMSSKRVNLIYNYLTDNGIAAARLISSAMGSEEPNTEINENDDADLSMAKNRRVFFKVR